MTSVNKGPFDMRYPNYYHGKDEVKVAVLADQMRVDDNSQRPLAEVIWGCAAIASSLAIFLTLR
jgi:hypothetical protein